MAWTAPRTWVALEVPTAAIFNTHVRDNLRELFHLADYQANTSTWSHGQTAITTASLTFSGTDLALLLFNWDDATTSTGAGAQGYKVDADLYWNATLIKAAICRGRQERDTINGNSIGSVSGFFLVFPAAATATFTVKVNGDTTAETITGARLLVLRAGAA